MTTDIPVHVLSLHQFSIICRTIINVILLIYEVGTVFSTNYNIPKIYQERVTTVVSMEI